MTCACCAASERQQFGSAIEAAAATDRWGTLRGCRSTSERWHSGVTGEVGDEGNKPVTTKTHVGSVQPAIVEGNAGGFAAVVGSTSAMKGSTVLPAPPLAAPVAKEFVMVPTGKLEPGTDSEGEVDERSIGAGESPHRAIGGAGSVARRGGGINAAEICPDESADDVAIAGACDGTVAVVTTARSCRCSLRRIRRDSSRWCRSPDRRRSKRKLCRR